MTTLNDKLTAAGWTTKEIAGSMHIQKLKGIACLVPMRGSSARQSEVSLPLTSLECSVRTAEGVAEVKAVGFSIHLVMGAQTVQQAQTMWDLFGACDIV